MFSWVLITEAATGGVLSLACNFSKKETLTPVFSCEFCETPNTSGRLLLNISCLFCFIKTSTILYKEKTTIKRYLLQSARNDVLENNFVLLQGTKIHQTQCISRKFFCQILLCSSIHKVFSCVEIQGDAMADC